MPSFRRVLSLLVLGVACAALLSTSVASRARAATSQFTMIEDDKLIRVDPLGTLRRMRVTGATVVRVFLEWNTVAPAPASSTPPHVDASNPASYPRSSIGLYDTIVRGAHSLGMSTDFVITGPGPKWAAGPGASQAPIPGAWYPSQSKYGQFVTAMGKRYGGHFRGIPAVRYWEIWNEPNFGYDLAPQAIHSSRTPVGPRLYRGLLSAAWGALHATGHGGDKIVIGQLAARGLSGRPTAQAPAGYPGISGQTKPLIFVRELYCVGGNLKPLRGKAASDQGCPANAGASRRFRAQNPALFYATGFGIHPYAAGEAMPPTRDPSNDPEFVSFNKIPHLVGTLDGAARTYGSRHRLTIYNNEYGYITNPPNNQHHFASPETAGGWLNEAEYISWKSPRTANYMQYDLVDPNRFSGFDTGLLFCNDPCTTATNPLTTPPKALYDDFRMPIWIPRTNVRRNAPVEIWGDVRPAYFARSDGHGTQKAQIQWAKGNSRTYRTIVTVSLTDPHGYIDPRIKLPGTGSVRILWSYPAVDPRLSPAVEPLAAKRTIFSRAVKVTVG